MIEHVTGDIFDGGDDVIVHGCNCMCTMGSGIAKQVRALYPHAWEADRATKSGDFSKLGTYSSARMKNIRIPGRNVTIVNAYTQKVPNPEFKPFDYEAFEAVIRLIKRDFAGQSIAFPRIGAGLAGGDWNRIEAIMAQVFNDVKVKVYTRPGEFGK